jgi:phosphoribosylformimino-5-aminoimidazole carboxamide ribotide isomerase
MIIYPAVDLYKGNCIRLFCGDFNQQTFYSNDPIEVANNYADAGAKFLHVVDLDGARQGCLVQHDLIIQMQCKSNLKIQMGGGIRNRESIEKLLNHGISRVILGSVAVNEPLLVKKWLDQYGAERIVLAFDVKINEKGEPILATQGWKNLSTKILWDLLDEYSLTAKHVLCTDISRDGTLQGPNKSLYQACALRYPKINFQASGGIQSLKDLQSLNQISMAGVIVGKALYEKKFSLSEAISEVAKC